jgi:hypothetical protein
LLFFIDAFPFLKFYGLAAYFNGLQIGDIQCDQRHCNVNAQPTTCNPFNSSSILCFFRWASYMDPMSVRRAPWIAHVKSWRDSDLTQADYCRRHALNCKTFTAWIKCCNSVPANLTLTLVPITVTQPSAAKELLLRHASGWQLAVGSWRCRPQLSRRG